MKLFCRWKTAWGSDLFQSPSPLGSGEGEREWGRHLWEGIPPPVESDYPWAPREMAGRRVVGAAGAPEVGLRALPREAQMVFFFISVSIGFFLL